MSDTACAVLADQLPVQHGSAASTQGMEGWKAELRLAFEHAKDRTVLRREHSGPLMVQRPFYPEGPVCHAYMLHPPGGVVGGDNLLIDVSCGNQASGLVTTPGATKYYGSDGRIASQQQHIKVENGALEWMPQETIFFNACNAAQLLRIDLSLESQFIGWDICCFGRPAGNYIFETGSVVTRLEVYIDHKPHLLERLVVSSTADMARLSGLKAATVSATMLGLALDAPPDWLEMTRAVLPDSNRFSVTLIEGLFVVRYLGDSAQAARRGFITVWELWRPLMMQRKSESPRIWAT